MMLNGSFSGIIDFQPVLLDLDGFSPVAYLIASGELPCGKRKMTGVLTGSHSKLHHILVNDQEEGMALIMISR